MLLTSVSTCYVHGSLSPSRSSLTPCRPQPGPPLRTHPQTPFSDASSSSSCTANSGIGSPRPPSSPPPPQDLYFRFHYDHTQAVTLGRTRTLRQTTRADSRSRSPQKGACAYTRPARTGRARNTSVPPLPIPVHLASLATSRRDDDVGSFDPAKRWPQARNLGVGFQRCARDQTRGSAGRVGRDGRVLLASLLWCWCLAMHACWDVGVGIGCSRHSFMAALRHRNSYGSYAAREERPLCITLCTNQRREER
jgi:hypothetical protein